MAGSGFVYLIVSLPIIALFSLAMALYFYYQVMAHEEGNERMKEIAAAVREGAIAYLKQQYKVVALVFVCASAFLAFLAFGLGVQSKWTPFAFLTGGFFSALSGFIGMITAVSSSSRTAAAARKSLNKALQVAFRSGTVMGLVVVGLGLLDISLWFIILRFVAKLDLREVTITMLSFGMGASLQALFARVGGGIFTKAADVGADLVGKIERNIPEDDPRNPAVIADNVGDNVGDVAGMGADLYESYTDSILSAAALGAAAYAGSQDSGLGAVLLPMFIAAAGIISSVIGVFMVKTRERVAQSELIRALNMGFYTATVLVLILSFLAVYICLHGMWGVAGAVIVGLIVGVIIGKSTEYYTSSAYSPTRALSRQSEGGPATVIISGLALGMISTCIPVLAVACGIIAAFLLSGGVVNVSHGLYGIAVASVGMLSTLGITLATDAYGPVADNAGGNATMAGLPEEVRKRTDALDALGNTTAAIGKGFAIGSAALTAMALVAAYIEEVKGALIRVGQVFIKVDGVAVEVAKANLETFMRYYHITLLDPWVLTGVFVGSMMAFLFSGLTMQAVARAAVKMVEEVRRQFREIKGLAEGKAKPDYARCIAISTKGAQREMMLPAFLAVIVPILTGLFLGVGGVVGLLIGAIASGFILAIFMANAGGAWDNAKKYIEEGNLGGKGSENHKAAVVGDTVGDPLKDTAGPSLNILIKLMSMVSVVVAGLTVVYNLVNGIK